MNEASEHEYNSFITLTYDDEHLPESGGLRKEDWQKFAKRLRANVGPFRFLMCGEYGEETQRPHYHALIFGIDFRGDRTLMKQGDHPLWDSKQLNECWKLGSMNPIGALTFESASYVARYTLKKAHGWRDQIPKYGGIKEVIDPNIGRNKNLRKKRLKVTFNKEPEFSTMSLKPGIGAKWFAKYGKEVFPRDEIVSRGKLARPPKYYDKILERENELMHRKVKSRRRAEGSKHQEDNSYDRLAVKEKVSKARQKNLKRALDK